MSRRTSSEIGGEAPSRIILLADVILYSIVAAAIIVGVLLAISVGLGQGLYGAVWLTLAIGWCFIAYGALKLRPSPAWKDENQSISLFPSGRGLFSISNKLPGRNRAKDESATEDNPEEEEERSKINELIRNSPPLEWYDTPEKGDIPKGSKAMVTGILVLVSSFLIDFLAFWTG